MPINFPDSPSVNDTYTYNSNSWKWNGTSWVGISNVVAPLLASNGGTGLTSFTAGDIIYANSTSSLATLSPTTSNYALQTNGAGTAPSFANVLPQTGTIIMYAGNTAPVGWLLCDGSAVSRTTYASLFAVVSTTFGVGDGATTFNVPNHAGRTVLGVGTGTGLTARALAATVGAETVAISTSEMASHNHTASDGGHSHAAATSGANSAGHTHGAYTDGTQLGRGIYGFSAIGGGYKGALIVKGSSPFCSSGNVTADHTHSFTTNSGTANITIANNGSGTAHNNMQPSLVVNFIIKT